MRDENNELESDGPAGFDQLLKNARTGDPLAIGKLLDNHRDYLLLIANQDLDSKLRGKLGSSDVVQESLLTAHQCFERFEGESKPELLAWLKKILSNDLLQAQRTFKTTQKRQVNRERPIQGNSSIMNPLVDPQVTPGTHAMVAEESALLHDAIEQLPADYQLVLREHSWHHKGFVEIGEVLGKSPEAIRKIWTRAVLKLQQILEKRRMS